MNWLDKLSKEYASVTAEEANKMGYYTCLQISKKIGLTERNVQMFVLREGYESIKVKNESGKFAKAYRPTQNPVPKAGKRKGSGTVLG